MQEPSFSTIFTRDRAALVKELGAESGPGSLQHIRRYLDELTERQRQERARTGVPLTAHAAQQSKEVVDAVRTALGVLNAVRAEAQVDGHNARRGHAESDSHARTLLALLLRLLSSAERSTPEPGRAGSVHAPPRRTSEPARAGSVRAPVRLELDSERLLDAVGNALAAAARAVDDSRPEPEPEDPWTMDPSLLQLVQNLMGARLRGNVDELLTCLGHLETDLRIHHGINVVTFDVDGDNEQLFEFSPGPTGNGYVTRRPALTTSAGLLRRGEVTGPEAAGELQSVRS